MDALPHGSMSPTNQGQHTNFQERDNGSKGNYVELDFPDKAVHK